MFLITQSSLFKLSGKFPTKDPLFRYNSFKTLKRAGRFFVKVIFENFLVHV